MPTAKAEKYIEGIGRRKSSTARVRITPSAKSQLIVNDKSLEDYFATDNLVLIAKSPLIEDVKEKFNITVKVGGGGVSSQADAIKLGLARAISKFDTELRKPLKKLGLLTRDSRRVERKMFGKKKSRKSAQWSKR